ncbi:MAG: hypothetical protein ACI8ZO_000856 [Flavobacteriales bacterium]
MKNNALSLSESIIELESILEKAEMNRNRLAYFAAFILRYAQRLQIEQNQSEAYRLFSMQIVNNYVRHYQNYEVMNEPVKSWLAAFNESSSWWATISQQYVMSVICFSRITFPKALLEVYDNMYDNMEDTSKLDSAYFYCLELLDSEWKNVLKRLSVYSSYLNRIQKNKQYAGLGLNNFRSIGDESLVLINILKESTLGERQRKLNLMDYDVHAQVEMVSKPGDINKLRMKLIRLSERKSVKEVIALISKG